MVVAQCCLNACLERGENQAIHFNPNTLLAQLHAMLWKSIGRTIRIIRRIKESCPQTYFASSRRQYYLYKHGPTVHIRSAVSIPD